MSNENQDWGFNYTLSNEDNSLELGVLSENAEHVVSIAGSGSRVLPLLAKQPKTLTCIDSSAQQLALTKLRFEAVNMLSYEEYVGFLGYPEYSMSVQQRKAIFSSIANKHSDIKALESFLDEAQWQSIIYLGRWEKSLEKFTNLVSLLSMKSFLSIENSHDWNNVMTHKSARIRWYLFCKILGSATLLKAFFYKGRLPKMYAAPSYSAFFSERFQRLISSGGLRQSCFAHMMLSGKVQHSSAFPIEAERETFNKIKVGAKNVEINYFNSSINEYCNNLNKSISCISLSDVPSYLDAKTYTNLLNTLSHNMHSGATIIARYFGYRPDYSLPSNLSMITEQHRDLIQNELTQFYDVEVFQAH